MYKKPLVSNKVFLIRQLANTKMQEGTSVIYHVKEFNFLLSKLVLVDIKFDNEVQALLTLSSLFCNWSSMWDYKIDFQRIRDLILSQNICRRNVGESTGSLFSTESRGERLEKGQSSRNGNSKSKKQGQSTSRKDITYWNCHKNDHFKSQCTPYTASKGKKHDNTVTAAQENIDDVLIYYVKGMFESRIMYSSSSFHVYPCKDLMQNFSAVNFGKVHLTNDEALDITDKGDINLRTSTSTI